MKRQIKTLLLLVTAGFLFVGPVHSKERINIPLSFDHYYTYDMVGEALKALHEAYPEKTQLDLIGKSEEGRAIYGLTISNPETGPALKKPGIYVDGNVHGNEIQAAEVCLYLADYLLGRYGKNPEVTQLVDKKTFYVVPIVNVDGRYHFFADPNTPSSNRSLRRPHDDDRDGLVDEDFPDDLDGDGNICQMRKRDPFGNFKTNPEDERLLVRVKPGEKGEWTILGNEGIDNDGDGLINEDAEGYVDGNRNWGFDWAPEYVQSGAGDYPFSGVGIKAIAKYIIDRPNICMAWDFHNSGGMYLRGPSNKTQNEFPRGDVEVYDYLGRQSERITPGYRYLIAWKDLYSTYGDVDGFIVQLRGAYFFCGELFVSASESFKSREEEKRAKPESGDDMSAYMGMGGRQLERLQFSDNLTQGELYKPWKPFKHPQYGDIEIGGWVKMSSRLPAPFMLKDLVHRNASAVIFSAKQTPEVSLEVFEVKKIGKDLYRVRTRLSNTKAMPSMSYLAQKVKLYPKDMLTLQGKNVEVVAGGRLTNIYFNKVEYKKYKPELQFTFVPGFGKVEHQFLVSGKNEVTICYVSRFAGELKKTVALKEGSSF
ncbi:MAG: hypothetical protein JXB26_17750 [Candidatus Aminicenantes bacterium]|nr:hypothetical protein [Candidatus Aminicenantes bacterium]